MNDPMIGRTIGRYRITEHLGRGGMAEVYKAYQPNLDRYVALKVMHTFLSDEKEFLARFEREAKVVATLRHPNIVQVYDFNNDGGVYYMVLEFIPGETLQDRLKRTSADKRQLSVQDALYFTMNIADAVGYAHKYGMVHRHAFERRGLGGKARIAIYTVEGIPMATAGAEMGNHIKAELAQRGIAFHPQKKPVRVEAGTRRIVFEDGSEASYDLLISVPPHEAPKVVRDAGLVNPSGWIPVDPQTLEVKVANAAGRVSAAGDVTVVPLPGRYKPDMPLALPKAGVFAHAHGEVIAHRIAAQLAGAAPDATFGGVGYCYLETGGGRAVKADGSFFGLPHPVMRHADARAACSRRHSRWTVFDLRITPPCRCPTPVRPVPRR